MRLHLKNHCEFKIRNHFKNQNLLFFYHVSKQKSTNWVLFEQKLKTLNLKFYRPSNNVMRRVLKESIYSNLKNLISGAIVILKLEKDKKKMNIEKLRKKINKEESICLAVKIEDKIYSNDLIKTCSSISYRTNILKLTSLLSKFTKSLHLLTKLNKSK